MCSSLRGCDISKQEVDQVLLACVDGPIDDEEGF